MTKKVAIIGAGITGLSAAWVLKQRYGKSVEITVIDQSDRVGGWIQTQKVGDFLFERGPRSCRAKGAGLSTLQLIEELGLKDEVIAADKASRNRYLYLEGRLQKTPSGPIGLFSSPMMKGVPKALWRERKQPVGEAEDETIEEFFNRRLGASFTESFIDPLMTGIYAGDIHRLSVKSCLPTLFEWEREYGSLTKGAFSSTKRSGAPSPWQRQVMKRGLFALKGGMETLTERLQQRLDVNFWLGTRVSKIDGREVTVGEQTHSFDQVIVALPIEQICQLTGEKVSDVVGTASMAVVNLGYRKASLTPPGFGYLVPSKEQQKILGCVFNSSVFPDQQRGGTALTVMIGGERGLDVEALDEDKCKDLALSSLQDHLGVKESPEEIDVFFAKRAIPQYYVGHQKEIEALRQSLPQIRLMGSGFDGIALNDCVAASYTKLDL